ncbi:MAG: hypothetical protein Terrestrivirus4_155 [Terrestrivirus sp.]|uniref:Uncharacterized protein n=1 Tax=Terrestrivirus sp. TaxID=2487775 RepID=A0A3G4ZMN3_9VIRU|nr:MAG: hypothetical protein Terrestrivirus4_155 [Terrestrivirus sp.]
MQINTLKVQPIPVDELTHDDIHKYGITTDRCAVINLKGNTLSVPAEGGTFDISLFDIHEGDRIDAKLYIYDRKPGSGHYFTVTGPSLILKPGSDGEAHVKFVQWGIAISFHLANC